MQYLGIDVHSRASVWCLLDEYGNKLGSGKTETTVEGLQSLIDKVRGTKALRCAQEVGTQAFFVHDAITATGAEIVSFNAAHLRMIAASRKKCDRRDAYWLAKTLQCGLTPQPVYIPPPPIRRLRRLLQVRRSLQCDRRRWHSRARAALRSQGRITANGRANLSKLLERVLEDSGGLDSDIVETVEMYQMFIETLDREIREVELQIRKTLAGNEVVERMVTIPGVGEIVAATLYAAIGEIERFGDFGKLSSYVGLVPSVRQTGETAVHGRITKQGNGALRAVLVQGAHRVSVSKSDASAPLRERFERLKRARGRRKIAVVGLARQILRIAYYVWRDGTAYDAEKARPKPAI